MEILFWLIGLALVAIIAVILGKSIRFILKIAANSLGGLVLLLIFNFIAGLFGISIEITFIHTLIVGVLGIFGIVILLIIQLL